MRNTLAQQIAWARGKAAQSRRLAAVARPDSRARDHALSHAATAEAVAATLETLAASRAACRAETRPHLTLVHCASDRGEGAQPQGFHA